MLICPTMSSHGSRRIPPPGASKKRKQTQSFHDSPGIKTTTTTTAAKKPAAHTARHPSPAAKETTISNQNRNNMVLAGYMAHEFLTKGTLLGQKFDPARTRAAMAYQAGPAGEASKRAAATTKLNENLEQEIYSEVANILKGGEVNIPEIVNPTQLARWIQMG